LARPICDVDGIWGGYSGTSTKKNVKAQNQESVLAIL
jgi:hypothetical protein